LSFISFLLYFLFAYKAQKNNLKYNITASLDDRDNSINGFLNLTTPIILLTPYITCGLIFIPMLLKATGPPLVNIFSVKGKQISNLPISRNGVTSTGSISGPVKIY
jgi:hypothetical protein